MSDDTNLAFTPNPKDPQVPTVDYNLSLYDLVDRFFSYFRYHNDDCMVSYQGLDYVQDPSSKNWNVNPVQKTLSRFAVLRRIVACLLSSRPFIGNVEVAPHKPNVNMGYFSMLIKYCCLPFKAVTSEHEMVKINFDRKLLEAVTYSPEKREKLRLEAQNNPNIYSNYEISDDTSGAFNTLIARSTQMQNTAQHCGTDVVKFGFAALLHDDPGWTTEPIDVLDLVFEPQAYWDTRTWSDFFIVRKMPAQEVVQHIRDESPYWNVDALRWALEASTQGRSIFRQQYNQAGYANLGQDNTPLCGENFMVKSFYADKAYRSMNLQGYYGNLLVVEGFYKNTNGNIQKVIFFPSADFYQAPPEKRTPEALKELGLDGANVLFSRELKGKKSIWDVLTVIPYNRSEPTLERQRGPGHELFNSVESLMRVDTSIFNIVGLMGVLFTKNRAEGSSAQTVQDLNIKMTGEVQDIGEREFIDQPFTHDLNAMLAVRSMIVQHTMAKAFLSGLDNAESMGEGRGGDLAKYRLVRDGRIHKHDIEDFGKGQEELYSKVLRSVLDEMNEVESVQDKYVKTLFYYPLIKEYGYDPELFSFDKKEVLEDNALPYWMSVTALRNGASHMGAAEMVLYAEIKQVFGDGLAKPQLDALNRMGIKSVLGPQDAIDILGDPRDQIYTDQDQVYQATMENAAILGSISAGTLSFEPVQIRETKDDPVAHLSQVHNPKATEIIQMLDDAQVAPSEVDGLTEEQLDTRVNLILRLAALTSHMSLHLQQLEFYGDKRDDVNQLKEETNAIIQSSEGMLNNLQINLRALQSKRADTMLRLQNLAPENVAAQEQAKVEMMKVQAEQARDQGKLELANKIAQSNMQMHRDKQLTAARDRAQRDRQAMMATRAKEMDAESKAASRQAETSAKVQSKIAETQVSTALKTQDAMTSTALKAKDMAVSTALKAKQTEANIAMRQKESSAKIEVQKQQAASKPTPK